MNQIRKISNLIFNIPRLILYSMYRLGFVIIHPIFSLMYKTRVGKWFFSLIKDIVADDDFLYMIPLLIIFATVSSLLWVLYHIIFPLAVCMTIGSMILYSAAIPTVVLIILGFFINEWMKTYGKKDGGVIEDKPKASLSLAGIEKLRPEIPVTHTGHDVPGRPFTTRDYELMSNGGPGKRTGRDYPVQLDGYRHLTYLPEARFRGINEFPSEGYSARQLTLPDGPWGEGGVYTEFYNNGILVQRVKKYEI